MRVAVASWGVGVAAHSTNVWRGVNTAVENTRAFDSIVARNGETSLTQRRYGNNQLNGSTTTQESS